MTEKSDLSTLLRELDALVGKMTPVDEMTLCRYSHGGGRLATPKDWDKPGHRSDGERVLVADFYDEANREGIVALVNAWPRLREEIAEAIKIQQHMDETLRPLVEELRKAAQQARDREIEACVEAERLRAQLETSRMSEIEQTKRRGELGLEVVQLRALVAQQQEALDRLQALVVRNTKPTINSD